MDAKHAEGGETTFPLHMPLNSLRLVELVLPQGDQLVCAFAICLDGYAVPRILWAWKGKHDGVGRGAWVR